MSLSLSYVPFIIVTVCGIWIGFVSRADKRDIVKLLRAGISFIVIMIVWELVVGEGWSRVPDDLMLQYVSGPGWGGLTNVGAMGYACFIGAIVVALRARVSGREG